MKGLELRRSFWEEVAKPIVCREHPDHFERMAVGAFGHGSEYLGLDDEVSRDHDWSPSFSIFLTAEDMAAVGKDIFGTVRSLPMEYRGYELIWGKAPQKGRNGVHTLESWLKRHCFIEEIPREHADWLSLREPQLLWATNGEVWHDPLGEVTATREHLAYYPESVWRKRLALLCQQLHQDGTYQVKRFLQRNDPVTVDIALHRFLVSALKMCFLLRQQYAPIYKWLHAGFLRLPGWPEQLRSDMRLLASPSQTSEKMRAVRRVLDIFMGELRRQIPAIAACGATLDGDDVFDGCTIAQAINDTIEDTEFRSIHYLLQAGGMDG